MAYIKVNKEWIDGLIKRSEQVESKLDKDNHEDLKMWNKFNISQLVGYISSAKQLENSSKLYDN